MSMFRRTRPFPATIAAAALVSVSLISAACSAKTKAVPTIEATRPDNLAFADETADPAATTMPAVDPIALGDAEQPFSSLPNWDEPSAIRTESGLILPVLETSADGYKVQTPCGNFRQIHDGTEIGRAHVVLDAGHGGREVGATGQGGSVEKELNLVVAKRTAELLEQRGATVVLTRETDEVVSLETRAVLNNRVKPGLFVSIHHNGGAPAGGSKPGTIVFTKSGSPESKRFGGLFFEELTPRLEQAAQIKTAAWEEYERQRLEHEALVAAYDEAVSAHDQATAENNRRTSENQQRMAAALQEPSGGATSPPASTTLPPPLELVPVPQVPPTPPPFTLPPVRKFSWAGSGNAGVRSWAKPNNEDYLALLRLSDDVPSVLAEFLYVTNPAEEELLLDPIFLDSQAEALANSITTYFGTNEEGSGFVADQTGDQDIGGGGSTSGCVEPPLE